MKTTNLSFLEFRKAFTTCGLTDQFSHQGLKVLYDYLTDLEDECRTEMELDVVALCGYYSEATIGEIAEDYNVELDEDEQDGLDEDEKEEALKEKVLSYLADRTRVCGETPAGTVVYCSAF